MPEKRIDIFLLLMALNKNGFIYFIWFQERFRLHWFGILEMKIHLVLANWMHWQMWACWFLSFCFYKFPCLFPFNNRKWWSIWLIQFLWKSGGPRSKVHLIHSVWANFQTSTNNVSLNYSYKTIKWFICY